MRIYCRQVFREHSPVPVHLIALTNPLESHVFTDALILVYGRDAQLTETRRWVLEGAGYKVITITELRGMDRLTPTRPVDLFILCHTLSEDECALALTKARELRPGVKVLVLTASSSVCPQGADEETLSAFTGPRALLSTVERLLHSVTYPR